LHIVRLRVLQWTCDRNIQPEEREMAQAPSSSKQPNFYDLSGDGIHITYATTTFEGPPLFIYHDSSQNRKFTGKQIQSVDTEAGTLVSVVIQLVPDLGSTTVSVLIPRVSLITSDTANITTYGITTLHKTSFFGPRQGQNDVYTVHQLQGTAEWRVFAAAKPGSP
jgi:hypothetical protein